jgi:hypothetical protein
MENLWHWIVMHWKDWGIAGVFTFVCGVFVWFFPNRKEWREERQAKANSGIDSRVLQALGNCKLWKGPRGKSGAGFPTVRTTEIAEFLKLDADVVADSLERLALQGRVSKNGGTFDDPSPIWLFVPR